MIKNIHFKFGSNTELNSSNAKCESITVFIGPNNSGKSTLLKEIDSFCTMGKKNPNYLIVEDIDFESETRANIFELSGMRSEIDPINTSQGIYNYSINGWVNNFGKNQLENRLKNPNERKNEFCGWYLNHFKKLVTGKNRFDSIKETQLKPYMKPEQNNILQNLFVDDLKRKHVQNILFDEFNEYLVLDSLEKPGALKVKFSNHKPSVNFIEKSNGEKAIAYFKNSILIDFKGDGVQSFVSLILEFIAGNPKLLLIDEPEAFLHPSLAFRLGKELGQIQQNKEKRIFVSTHSSHFLLGCIQSGCPISIIRLDYKNGVGSARRLEKNLLSNLTNKPLLRSLRLFDGLFFHSVIVVEGDSDRILYNEINERLLQFKKGKGLLNCLFINVPGKDVIYQVIKPLRVLGIPSAAIFDIDIFEIVNSATWPKLFQAVNIPKKVESELTEKRKELLEIINKRMDTFKKRGVKILSIKGKKIANNLIETLGRYGIFVVPYGALESWLNLSKNIKKDKWITETLEKMGQTSTDSNFLKPSTGGIWKFISNINRWVEKAP